MNHTVTLDLTEDEYYELKSALEMNRRLAEHFDNDERRFRSQEIQKKLDASERLFRKVDQQARET
jgi:RNA binding exosome subunit